MTENLYRYTGFICEDHPSHGIALTLLQPFVRLFFFHVYYRGLLGSSVSVSQLMFVDASVWCIFSFWDRRGKKQRTRFCARRVWLVRGVSCTNQPIRLIQIWILAFGWEFSSSIVVRQPLQVAVRLPVRLPAGQPVGRLTPTPALHFPSRTRANVADDFHGTINLFRAASVFSTQVVIVDIPPWKQGSNDFCESTTLLCPHLPVLLLRKRLRPEWRRQMSCAYRWDKGSW